MKLIILEKKSNFFILKVLSKSQNEFIAWNAVQTLRFEITYYGDSRKVIAKKMHKVIERDHPLGDFFSVVRSIKTSQ